MKITHVADYFDCRTGNPLAVYAKRLSEKGNNVSVLASNIPEKPGTIDDSKAGARIERFNAVRVGTKAIFPSLFPRLLFARDLEIVHAHVLGFFSLFASALLKPLKKYRLVVTPDFDVSNPKAGFPKSILVWLLMKFPLQQANLILPFTELEKQELHSRFRVPLEKMRVLPIGINYAGFQEKPGRDYRKELGLQKKFVLLGACYLQQKKNIEMALEALEELPEEIVFVHAGGFPDAAYKKKIDGIIEANSLKGRVFFLGNKTIEEMPAAYKCADVFVQTGFKESYCIPIIEAMAAGLPAITTKVGVANEAIEEGKNGFFIKNSAELKEAVAKLWKNPASRKAMAGANSKKAKQFDWEKIISDLEWEYKRLANKKMLLD